MKKAKKYDVQDLAAQIAELTKMVKELVARPLASTVTIVAPTPTVTQPPITWPNGGTGNPYYPYNEPHISCGSKTNTLGEAVGIGGCIGSMGSLQGGQQSWQCDSQR